jgi:hypothetical protein
MELIEKLKLEAENQFFTSAFSRRRRTDSDYLNNWRKYRYNKA